MADFHLIDCDSEKLYDEVLTQLEQSVGEPLYPGDERRYFGEALTLLMIQMYSVADDAGRQSMLQYAKGEVLDAIGARLGVERLSGSPATCTIRFSVQTPLNEDVFIPKYSKVKTTEGIYFATKESCTIKAGAFFVDCEAESTGTGSKFNGYTPGSINEPVDLVGYVYKAENITTSKGGDDGEPYTEEGDNLFRERIRLAPYKLSVAGPKDAYIYWAKTADADISDIKVLSERETMHKTCPVVDGKLFVGGSHLEPDTLRVYLNHEVTTDYESDYSDDLLTITLGDSLKKETQLSIEMDRTLEGHVHLVPLMKGGTLADQEVKSKILKTVTAKDVRPMTDYVDVIDPVIVSYDVELKYYTTPDTESDIVDAVEGEGGAIDAYNEWQTTAIGRDINPDTLRQLILTKAWQTGSVSGAVRIDITAPEFQALDDNEVAQFSGKFNVSHENMLGVI